ncbi:hypothetical protein DFR49_4213 [Hephaestia caeni]|uniref:Uncharacterized protein n=1 Tax=Hephaestia caeni TaxID=645617 RepID=A0A397NDB8_9SPHN|nr:hypothetical protein [Hephaestia caeni]RIA35436.1 hypothetical protein DFR49_4213 [Hephaestia caeni]
MTDPVTIAAIARRAAAKLTRRPAPRLRTFLTLAPLAALAACARQVSSAVEHGADTPGFLLGLWHGFIFPVAWVLSLFMPDVAIYAVPNNGGWYDFGYFVGIVFLGVGARKGGKTVYIRTRRS